ncbi:MAG: chromosome condensation regulator [Hyperionvirus sp.]|uniref:Chromosome condensation regulator n=1 Tax=Hyperionvirus sp. TaxID=2487770 RepID=A0A3G5A7F1_9VIRU|nr:MAG: chromosome condensation regulator [Hyperionvirus sp.]
MDLISLIDRLPVDLLYIISNYDPSVIFRVNKKYDWFKLIKMNFSLSYERDLSTNEQMMKVYWDNCFFEKSKIICNLNYTIRLEDGSLMSCGDNSHGQLGIGGAGSKTNFFEISGLPKNIVEIANSDFSTIIRLTDGTLMGCGFNTYGQLGLGNTTRLNTFTEIRGIPKNIVDVICDPYHTIIRLTDGTLMGCGYNKFGQLGLGDKEARNRFTEIKGIPKNIVEVTCNCYRTIIRLTDGTLMGCGYNNYGQLGLRYDQSADVFLEIKNIPKNILRVICSELHTIIVLTDGRLMACGYNLSGQLGLGDTRNRYLLEKISGIPQNIVEVACSTHHTIIRLTDGTLMGCGNNEYGQLGLGHTESRKCFTKIREIPKNIAKVFAFQCNTILILTDGGLMGCGNNEYGQLGLGHTESRKCFTKIRGIPKNVVEVMGHCDYIIIKLRNGKLMGCGSNRYGQLGLGDKRDRWLFEEIKIEKKYD